MTDNRPSKWRLKIRTILAKYSTVAIAAGVLVVLLGGWLAYGGLVDTGEAQEQTEVGTLEYTSEFEYSATVEDGAGVYEEGETLQGLPAYPTAVAPTIDVQYRLAETGSLDQVEMNVEIDLVIEETVDGVLYWQERDHIDAESVSGTSGTIEIEFSKNIPQIEEDIETIQQDLGATIGEIDAYIEAEYSIVGTVGDRAETAAGTTVLDVNPGGETYEIETTNSNQQQPIIDHQTVEQSPDLLQGGIGIILMVTGLAVSATLLAADRQGVSDLSPHEQSWLAYREDREEFNEWITTISLPDRARNLPQAKADTLADLVDFAIDSGNSVIEDPTNGTYYVVHDGTRYEFSPPAPPEQRVAASDYVEAVTTTLKPGTDATETDNENEES